MSRPNSIRSVLVGGGGIVGLSAALAFARALPGIRVNLLELPADPAALADRLPGTLPSIHRFHERIGIDELELVRSGAATHIVGTRFENWGEDWYHGHGNFGLPGTAAPFHWIWLRARQARKALPFHFYSPAAALAAAGKFVHPDPDPDSPLHAFDYGLRIDPPRYRDLLAAHADRHRIGRARGELGGFERRADGGIAALRLKGGRRIEADLFIDASGPAAPLLSMLENDFEDWSESLPCDRLLLRESGGGEPSPTDTVTAMPWGWRWQSPSPTRRIDGFAFASAISGEKEPRAAAGPEAELVSLKPGRRPQPWLRNVLAIGDGAVAADPLCSTPLHLAHNAILRALDLLPDRDCHRLALREYIRLTEVETRRVRDFIALYYLASPRRYGPYWKAMTKRMLPDSLAHTLDQWRSRGRLPFYEEESFTRESWLAVLLGMGLVPRAIDYRAEALDAGQCVEALEQTAKVIAALPAQLPTYPDYLRRMLGR